MKLRNKKTGKIVETDLEIKSTDGFGWKLSAKNLAELNEEWEDYEEPKLFYVVDLDGEILLSDFEDKTIEKAKELGNYFETDEEAEKAVEKLKAWKRLKDKGFRFTGIGQTIYDMDCAEFDIGSEYLRERDLRGSELNKDLDLLFGGEE